MPVALKRWQVACATLLIGSFSPTLVFAEAINWQICLVDAKRITCVVDGDTLWYQGTKIRLIGIDAPEVEGRCRAERALANQATVYLTALLNTGHLRIAYDGQGRYGRNLARLWVQHGEVGPAMIAAGLAEPFGTGRPAPWCR